MYSPILGGCDYSICVVNILNRLRRMIKHEKIKERESNEPCPCSICSNVLKRCKDSHLDLHLDDVSHPSPLEREIQYKFKAVLRNSLPPVSSWFIVSKIWPLFLRSAQTDLLIYTDQFLCTFNLKFTHVFQMCEQSLV